MFFWLHNFCGYLEGMLLVNQFNHTSLMTVVTPTDSPESFHNRWVIKVFACVLVITDAIPLGLNDQIYQQGNISFVRSNINVFSLKPDVRRKRRSHGVRRNGLSRRKQRLNRFLDDLLRIANNNGRHELLYALSSILVSRLKPTLDDADRRSLRHSDWFKLKMIMAFSFNKPFPRIPQLPPKTKFIKIKFINQGIDLLNISNIFRDHRVTSKIQQYF